MLIFQGFANSRIVREFPPFSFKVRIATLTRNQVYRQRYRGFESHPLRQKSGVPLGLPISFAGGMRSLCPEGVNFPRCAASLKNGAGHDTLEKTIQKANTRLRRVSYTADWAPDRAAYGGVRLW